MVSPWAGGGSLVHYLKENPSADRTRFICETADALKYLHEQNIIHGDVKGSNVLLSQSIHVLLCDFGMSRSVNDNTQSQLRGGGSNRWMAPEIWECKGKTLKSDVFSFGITTYEVLSGKLPFYDRDSFVVPYSFCKGERPPKEPERSPSGKSYEPIWNIADNCWEAKPEARPPMAEVFDDLSALLIPSTPSIPREVQREITETSLYVLVKGKIKIEAKPCNRGDFVHISWNAAEGGKEMLRAEITAWKSLSHRHILQFCGLYNDGGNTYMVSLWAENGSLPSYLERNPTADRARFLRETADALRHLSQRNIIHGDIKGSNILVSANTQALLCDFGMSRPTSVATLPTLKSGGTPRYMAPELWDDQPKSFASDNFAFGMTISEILSGNVPFQGCNDGLAIFAALSKGDRPPKEPKTSPIGKSYIRLWDVAGRCWQAEPAARPSASDIFRDLLEPPSVAKPLPGRDEAPATEINPDHHAQNGDSPKIEVTVLNSTTSAMAVPRVSTASSRVPSMTLNLKPGGEVVTIADKNPVHETYRVSLVMGTNALLGTVAVKVLRRTEEDPVRLARHIRREAPVWHKLCHPNILPLIGIAEDTDRRLCLVSPWMGNGSLNDYLSSHPGANRPEFIVQTASALVYLHENGIVHGELKASNILVSSGGETRALLSNFGFSRRPVDSAISDPEVAGAVRWQAPELWCCSPKSFQSDSYAFAMTVYEILSGNEPYHDSTGNPGLVLLIGRGKRPSKQPEVSPHSGESWTYLWDVVEHCWKSDAYERPSMKV
ncbi:hypothetical protein FRB99_006899, partial [Tulasnella sp. 403]